MLLEHPARSPATRAAAYVFATRSGRPLGQGNVLRAPHTQSKRFAEGGPPSRAEAAVGRPCDAQACRVEQRFEPTIVDVELGLDRSQPLSLGPRDGLCRRPWIGQQAEQGDEIL